MKKQFFAFLVLILFFTVGYGQNRNRQDFQKRRQQQMEQLKKDLKLNKDQIKKFDAIYKDYNDKMAKLREEISASGDFRSMRPKMTELNTKRTESIKKILKKDQLKTYEKILKDQATRRAQRGRRDGRGGGGGIR